MNKQLIEAMSFYGDHPYEFVCDAILDSSRTNTYPDKNQELILKSLSNNKRRKAIKSGHGVGKTALLSWIIIWFMFTRPYCRIPCTAPTQAQLFDILWAEINKWINKMPDKRLSSLLEVTSTHVYNRLNPETWFAVAKTSNKPENMQGFHAEEILFVIDEASGVKSEIFEVISGALSTEGAMCIMTGNPTQISGTFYDAFHKNRDTWDTFTVSCINSDRVSRDYIETMKKDYGEDSNIFRVRVLGEFPIAQDDTLIPLSWAEQAAMNEFEKPSERASIHIGCDVARYGDDSTEIYVRMENTIVSSNTYRKQSTMETVGNIMLLINKYDDRLIYVNVDDTGVGGGVTDRLVELCSNNKFVTINPVNNGSSSNSKYLKNKGTEVWYNMKLRIRDISIPNDEQLIAQLTTRKYKIGSNGLIELESKDKMKERGLKSPDKADALALCLIDPNVDSDGCIAF